ncbi:hypothetical protein E4Q23_15490 [Candidatus Accumulibacter phosphatis]|uniref:Uncharacterized protein n=1 Tax=Candidatus Accumulibacter phosphatis TaxID=327160 RepID=A0ABX1TXN7_9PROT|nr:hypothetical protein [Candidatus Accumulibacter phosphatis]
MGNDDDELMPRLAADAAVTAGLLDSGRTLAWVSGMTLLITALVWLLGHAVHSPALVGAVVMAAAQAFFCTARAFRRRHLPLLGLALASSAGSGCRSGSVRCVCRSTKARGRFSRSGSCRTATRRHPAADLAGCLRDPATGLHRHCPLALTA